MTTTITITLPRPHSAQRQILSNQTRFTVVCCGRRFGKTQLGVIWLLQGVLEGKPGAWFSPTYKMSLEIWESLKRTLAPLTPKVNERDRRLELPTGGIIDIWSLDNADSVRGRKYARMVVDEAAMIEKASIWQASLRPLLTDYRGKALFLSTPKGHNLFFDLWNLGNDPHRKEWVSYHFPTTANPFIDPAEVEAARHDLPQRIFEQEYLAIFTDDAGGVFRKVDDACTAGPAERAEPDHTIVAGLDFGKTNDFTVLSIFDATTKKQIYLDRFNQIDWPYQRARVIAACKRFGVHVVHAEENSIGGPNISELERAGLHVQPFITNGASKGPLIESFALAIEQGDVTLLDDPVQIAELRSYEMVRLASGRFAYSAPEGKHDDTVIAGALGWYGCLSNRRYGGIHV